MADGTGIEWARHPETGRGATWNPIVGCSIVSPGCTHCYAMGEAARQQRMAAGAGRTSHYDGTTTDSRAGPVWTGKLALAPEHILTAPLRWREPRGIFVNSMGDLFHEAAPIEWIDQAVFVMAKAHALGRRHVFQVLTKRAARQRDYWREVLAGRLVLDMLRIARPLPNVWLGVSAERQDEWDQRRDLLVETPAAVRFVSAEPLLGPIEFARETLRPAISWVIVGGESGPRARPMHPDWARSLRDQCTAAGVPFLFKQWGEWAPIAPGEWRGEPDEIGSTFTASIEAGDRWFARDGYLGDEPPRIWSPAEFSIVRRVGKKRAGRLLDGREWNDMPEALRVAA